MLGKTIKNVTIEYLAPLGLCVLMKESTTDKTGNMIENIKNCFISPVELIVRKIKISVVQMGRYLELK